MRHAPSPWLKPSFPRPTRYSELVILSTLRQTSPEVVPPSPCQLFTRKLGCLSSRNLAISLIFHHLRRVCLHEDLRHYHWVCSHFTRAFTPLLFDVATLVLHPWARALATKFVAWLSPFRHFTTGIFVIY